MRKLATLIVLLGLPGVARAEDPLVGTWDSRGEVEGRGSFRGEVTVTNRGSGRYVLDGAYVFAKGPPLVWTAKGRVQGDRLRVSLRITNSQGIIGGFGGLFSGGKTKGRGAYAITQDTLTGRWRTSNLRVEDVLQRRAGSVGAGVDLDLVGADGKPVPEQLEQLQGLPVPLNLDDDDYDGGRGDDGQVVIVSDKDDPDGTEGEDDLVAIRISISQPSSGARLRLRFGERIAVWRDAERRRPVLAGADLPPESVTLWVEGRAASRPGRGEAIELELLRDGGVAARDTVVVHVTRSAFLLVGHGGTGSRGLSEALSERAFDRRRRPTIVRGRDAGGRTVWWSVYDWDTQKGAKIALSTPDSVVVYDGHSNFGLGFAFRTNLTRVSEFMNIANPQVSVNWEYLRDHQEHPRLMVTEQEYADDGATPEPFDPVAVPGRVRGTHSAYAVQRYPVSGGAGQRCSLTRGPVRWQDSHFGGPDNRRIVVKAGARDMPAKRWAALYLHSCYSGPYYLEAFGGRGVLFFTTERAWTDTTSTTLFLLANIDGLDNETILRRLDEQEDIHDYRVWGP